MNYTIIKATKEHLNDIMDIASDARELLKSNGSKQWNTSDGYPNEATFLNDIKNQILYVCTLNNKVIGVCAYQTEIDSNYNEIDGQWLSQDANYLSVHRIAVKKEYYSMGVSMALLEYAKIVAKSKHKISIKVDTHELNIPMQKLLNKHNYSYCGVIYLKNSTEDNKRLAFELII